MTSVYARGKGGIKVDAGKTPVRQAEPSATFEVDTRLLLDIGRRAGAANMSDGLRSRYCCAEVCTRSCRPMG